ncbi:putative SorC-family transcriptional regulator [Klebsiella michiganensis]|nr:putative SorC-family transcriptional regulator [Klebsiella michiganensis]
MSKEDDIRLDQKVRAAWMYYIAGQNQSEIASQLGTSRPVVQRLIAAAKEEGIVSISLHHPVGELPRLCAAAAGEVPGLSSAISCPPLTKKAPWIASPSAAIS